jgi:hypothetical protein
MSPKEKNYVDNALGKIHAILAGASIGANIVGLNGREYHYDMGERARKEMEKVVMKLYKYGKKVK